MLFRSFGGEAFCVGGVGVDADSDGFGDDLQSGTIDLVSCDADADPAHASGDTTEDLLSVWVEGTYTWAVTFVTVEQRSMLYVPSITHIDLDNGATLSVRGRDCDGCAYIDSLQSGQSYYVRVVAGNSAGESASATSAEIATPSTIPGTPRDVVVAAVDSQSVEVQWNRPLSDGGDAISSYLVEVDTTDLFDSPQQYYYYPSGASSTAYDYAYIINGLNSNTTYHIRITAINSVPFQDNENWELTTPPTVTPTDISPDPPAAVSVERLGEDRARIWVTDPERTGGQELDAYELVLSTSSSFDENVITETISVAESGEVASGSRERFFDIGSLQPGEVYYVVAAAVTAVGTSSGVQSATTVLPSRSADAPTSVVTSTVLEQSTPITVASVSWQEPTSDGGSSITGYRVDHWHRSSVPEVQTITLRRANDDFGLIWRGQTTNVDVSPNATASILRYVLLTDLESSAGLGQVEVTRTSISDGYEWQVTFLGNEGDQPLLQCDAPNTTIGGAVVPSCTVAETVRGQREGGVGEVQTVWFDSTAVGYYRLRQAGSVWSTYIAVNASTDRIVEALQDLSDVGIVSVEVDANSTDIFRVEFEPSQGDIAALDRSEEHTSELQSHV